MTGEEIMDANKYGRQLARNGVDEHELDEIIHNLGAPDQRRFTTSEAIEILTGYYREKRDRRELGCSSGRELLLRLCEAG
jgi:hypothetical protein